MSQKYPFVIGTTEPQDFQLRSDRQAFSGTGMTALEIVFREAGVSATIAWLIQANGTVRVTAITGVVVGSTYAFRIKVTDASGKVTFFPNGVKADLLEVLAV